MTPRRGLMTMEPVSAEIVESTWRDVASLSPGKAQRLMEEAADQQPALLAYVLASTAHSRDDVQELAVYLYFVVLKAFERAAGDSLSAVSTSEVNRVDAENEFEFERLAGEDQRFLIRAAEGEISAEPFVMRYVVEALMEDSDSDLDDEELGILFFTLKTVVNALSGARRRMEK
jgi:hypothetical protein